MLRLLSIVIPTHNRVSQLRQCLTALRFDIGHSVESEIVVIDDGSQAVEAMHNKNLCAEMGAVYHCVSSNKGAAAARNLGIDKTSGTWIAFLDDDVCIDPGWYREAVAELTQSAHDVVGIEGRVRAQGGGVWDREVENTAGGLYLSCHIFYRRDILEAAGRFDEHFTSRYPSCEDHELACRMLMHGRIVFAKNLYVAHLPRNVKLPRYVLDSWYRMRSQLEAELYFFLKHRDRYHTVRHARTFWGTYAVIALRHWFVTIKRRTASVLLRHPLQGISLLSACLLEQLCALWLFPRLLQKFVRPPCRFFGPLIDSKRTREFWRLPSDMPLTVLSLKPRLLRSLLFPITKRPVYSLQMCMREVQRISSCSGMRIFLRIDDVFLSDADTVLLLCKKLGEKRVGYCAAVTGSDLAQPRTRPLLERIVETGGQIGLHGFSHTGRFGPYASELLQLKLPELHNSIQGLLPRLPQPLRPRIFVPPFNAINREQILLCARYFNVVCGGPETVRFTDGFIGPVALPGSAWYFASLQPWYDTARHMVASGTECALKKQRGFVCITVHMADEAIDDFTALMELIDQTADSITPWNYICAQQQ